ncbi:unnamed protein product [Cylicostephanus goldi]|uniref:Ground-like domain-containing protein n=1 Tax=Cylicostephanus goldi TaxID=71465 RepID=A0A3P7N5S5_CYLGO|nr:unnamed protein product [Cylicostephanus goldi]
MGCGCAPPPLPPPPPICLPSIQLPPMCPPPPPPCPCPPPVGIESNHTEVKLHAEVRNKLGGEWVVACSSKPVTFVSQSRQYCMDGQEKTWCYAFQLN